MKKLILTPPRPGALDGKAPTPILGDTLAAAVADRIAENTECDFAKLKLSLIAGTALRAKKLDDVIRGDPRPGS